MSVQNNLLFENVNGNVVATLSFVKPAAPVILPLSSGSSVAANGLTMTVKWQLVKGVTGYIVNYTPNIGGVSSTKLASTITELTLTGLVGTTYNFTVTAVNVNVSQISSLFTISLLSTPSAPSLSAVGYVITVRWNSVTNATNYIVSCTGLTNQNITAINGQISYSTTFTTISISLYTITVQAQNGFSSKTSSSNITLLAAPTISSISLSSISLSLNTVNIDLIWDQNTNATGYIIECTGLSSKTINSNDILNTSFYGISLGNTYIFTIKSINNNLNITSNPSLPKSIKAPTYGKSWILNPDTTFNTYRYIVNKNNNWYGISISSSGQYQSVVGSRGTIYSNNYGVSWNPSNNNYSNISIAMSSSGQYQTLISDSFIVSPNIFYSFNYGIDWNVSTIDSHADTSATSPPLGTLLMYPSGKIAMSSSGQYQIFACGSMSIIGSKAYIGTIMREIAYSSNFGVTWNYSNVKTTVISQPNNPSNQWSDIKMSSNGSISVAVCNSSKNYGIAYSYDYGATWSNPYINFNGTANYNTKNIDWTSIAISADGQYQTAASYTLGIVISSNYGVNWITVNSQTGYSGTNTVNKNVWSIAMSSNGSIQIASLNSYSYGIIYSQDYGRTWNNVTDNTNTINTGTSRWSYVAMSADGSYQAAVQYEWNGNILSAYAL